MSDLVATVCVISIGEMGAGVARLLKACGFNVVTPGARRAQDAGVEIVANLEAAVQQSDYVLSIVPPAFAADIASDVARACDSISSAAGSGRLPRYYLELNAISPQRARGISTIFQNLPSVRFLDGGIIGGPPKLLPDAPDPAQPTAWKRPSIVTSGPSPLDAGSAADQALGRTLNARHVDGRLGAASGLKICFASLTKGFAALATQSFTTAHALGVLPALKDHLGEFAPDLGRRAERALPDMAPKAHRWVAEMGEIRDTMELFGGFGYTAGASGARVGGVDLFQEIADVFQYVSERNDLQERTLEDDREGVSADEVAEMCGRNLEQPERLE